MSHVPQPTTGSGRPTIGLLSQELIFETGVSYLNGVETSARHYDVNLVHIAGNPLRSTLEFEIQSNIFYDLISAHNVDALLIASNLLGVFAPFAELTALCHGYQPLPIVSLGMIVDGIPSVVLDNTEGMYAELSHLIEIHGYRRIAYISGSAEHPDAQERQKVYLQALADHDIPVDPDLILPGDFQAASACEAVRVLLDERQWRMGRDVEAIVTANDYMALGAIRELQARQVHVPEDVAVVGFDDIMLSRLLTPPLTTVHAPFNDVARRGLEILLDWLAGKSVPTVTKVSSRAVIRQSCGCSETAQPGEREGIVLSAEMIGMIENDPQRALWGLNQKLRDGRDMLIWERALAALRRHVPALPKTESGQICKELWEVLTATAYLTFQDNQYNQLMQELGRALISCVDLAEITDILAARLPQLGIRRCYLALYENPPAFEYPQRAPEWSRLHLAYTETERLDLPAEGLRFPTCQFLPQDALPQHERYTLIAEALYFRQTQIGFIVFDYGARDVQIYTMLQSQISSALQGAALVRQSQEHAAEIARQKYILDTFMANVPDSIYFKDRESRITHTNMALARLAGFHDPSEILGKSDFDFFPEEQARPKYEQEQTIIRTGQPLLAIEEPDAGGRWALTTKMPLRNERGEIIGTFGISRDITELKQVQHELAASYEEIRILNDQLNDENVRMHAEMDLARQIQTALLPQMVKHLHPDFEIAATMLPAEEVGGDYYDVALDREGALWLGIGDVSGHGVTPGLIMMMAQTVHTTITTNYHASARDIVCMINKVLFKNVRGRLKEDHFMTFTTLKYLGNGRFQHAGAHLKLIVYRQRIQMCDVITTQGTWLNFVPDIEHATVNAEFTVDVGDLLVLYTDGLTEVWNSQKNMLDIHGFTEIVTRHAEKEVEVCRDAILHDVMTWCQQNQKDDMSLIVVRRIR